MNLASIASVFWLRLLQILVPIVVSWFVLSTSPVVELLCSRRSSFVRHCNWFHSHRCLCTCDLLVDFGLILAPMPMYLVILLYLCFFVHGIQPWTPCVCGNALQIFFLVSVSVLDLHNMQAASDIDLHLLLE